MSKNLITNIFKEKEKNNHKTNIGYIVAGYPSVDFTKKLLNKLDDTNIDILEIGIPYSDPLADGKYISEASFKASENNVTTDTVFDLLEEVKENINKPLIFLVYYNLIFSYGIDKFIEKMVQSNIKGAIIPDLPYEENEEIFEKFNKFGLSLIPLISVTSEERIGKLIQRGAGFIYAIGSIGVTGSQQVDISRLEKFIEKIRLKSDIPIAVGFGIKNNEDVKQLRNYADGVIVGTSIVKLTTSDNVDFTIKEINNIFK